MNERIEELLIEAHKQTDGGIYNGHLSSWTEKFAELIVNECIEQVITGPNEPAHYAAVEAALRLKKHFGVE